MRDRPAPPRREPPGKWQSLGLTVAVHLGLFLFLFFGIRWQSQPPASLEVELASAPQRAATPAETPKPPPRPAEQPRPQPRPEPPPEPKAQPKPEIATKAPEKKPEPKPEQKKPEQKPEPRKPEAKAEPPKPAQPPPEDYLKQQLEQERKRAEAARREEQTRREEDARLANMLKADAARASAARSQGDFDKYKLAIQQKVRGNLLRPPGLSGNPEAVFEVDQLPSGEVLAIRLKRSSGLPALDDAIERSIRRSSPLPLPEQRDLFQRTLELRFRPLED